MARDHEAELLRHRLLQLLDLVVLELDDATTALADEVVVVAVNKTAAEVSIPITIVGGTAPAMLTPTVTSASQNLIDGTPVAVTGGVFTATLPATSVTTFH